MSNGNSLTCSVNLEWQIIQGGAIRKLSFKNATINVLRNEFRKLFVEVLPKKGSNFKFEVKDVIVHNKFMNEGKASINFPQDKCILFLSNAPPSSLVLFLRNFFIKMTLEETTPTKLSLHNRLLSKKMRMFEEISPVTNAEFKSVMKKTVCKGTDATPCSSTKRKKPEDSDGSDHKLSVAKKLYAVSPILNEPLTIEQKEIMNACLNGRNVFFTGSAGTGKSYLLKKIIAALPPDVTFPTASTGVAACHIGGITLYQFAGIGSGEADLQTSFSKASRPGTARVWRKCKHLIIDEISMIDGKYFEKIEAVARNVRKNDKPFGGIQLILCGDFFQLPPVSKNKSTNFCFQTPAWNKSIDVCFELTHVYRQNDLEFVDLLNAVRVGNITPEITDRLLRTGKQTIEVEGILATRLCSHTNDADAINRSKLEALPGDTRIYEARDSDTTMTQQLDQRLTVPSKLTLNIGAQVMLLKNLCVSDGLVNGARGIVTSFKDGFPVVRFRNSKNYHAKPERFVVKLLHADVLTRVQVPLKLAWAFSIHKSQGLTLDCVEMSLSKVFEAGQAYVALSRAKSLTTLRVLDIRQSNVYANPEVIKFYKKFKESLDCSRIIPLTKPASKKRQATSKLLKNNKPLVKIC